MDNLNILESLGDKESFSISGHMSSTDKNNSKLLGEDSQLSGINKHGSYGKTHNKRFKEDSGFGHSKVTLKSLKNNTKKRIHCRKTEKMRITV